MNKNKPVYWECINNKHKKFWAAHILKKVIDPGCPTTASQGYRPEKVKYILVRKWGRIGNKPQTMEQEFVDKYEAEEVLRKLIWAKENKGYKPVF